MVKRSLIAPAWSSALGSIACHMPQSPWSHVQVGRVTPIQPRAHATPHARPGRQPLSLQVLRADGGCTGLWNSPPRPGPKGRRPASAIYQVSFPSHFKITSTPWKRRNISEIKGDSNWRRQVISLKGSARSSCRCRLSGVTARNGPLPPPLRAALTAEEGRDLMPPSQRPLCGSAVPASR